MGICGSELCGSACVRSCVCVRACAMLCSHSNATYNDATMVLLIEPLYRCWRETSSFEC